MGKAIVYCQICGLSLHESDFEKGKASRVDNRPYCSRCRPVSPTPPTPRPVVPPPPTSRRISDRVPVVRPPPVTPRPFKPAAPRRASPAALWGSLGFIAAVVAVGLTLALAGRRPDVSDVPPPLVEPPPTLPRPQPPPAETELDLLRRLLAAPPAQWKREEIEAALARRPELADLRRSYERGLLGLGLRDGLVGHWTLDEKEGTVARDVSGRGHDGKIIGTPERVPGRIGGALRFRGNSEDGVEIPSLNELDLIEPKTFSLSAWFRPDALPAGRTDPDNDSWHALIIRAGMHMGLCFDTGGRIEMAYWLHGPKKAFHATTATVPLGAWTHVAAVVDSAAGRTRVHLNGRPAGETAWTPRSRVHRVNGTAWRIGVAAPRAKEYAWALKGALDDVRFYARALQADEIALLAEASPLPEGAPAGRRPSDDGLILHLRADAGVSAEGTTVNAWGPARAEGDERPAWKAAGGRTSIVFDGRNDRLHLPAQGEHAFRETDSFTLLATLHLEAPPPPGRWMTVLSKSIDQSPWYGIWIDDAGRWVFGSPLNLHGSPAKTGWTTLAAVQLGGRERRLYVDGARVATGPPMNASGAGDLWIGGTKGRGEYLNGALLELKLWRRALDPAELLTK